MTTLRDAIDKARGRQEPPQEPVAFICGCDQKNDHDPLPREQVAYEAFRRGFMRGGPPRWPDLEPWMRDAIKVAYLQGTLDRGKTVL